jgi:uncharacterized membrane protein
MDNSIVLAQILGIIFLALGLELLFKRKFVSVAMNEALEKPASLWIMGLIALLIGAVMVVIQCVWSADWRVVVTIIGWAALLKGLFILFCPHVTEKLYRKWNNEGFLMTGGAVATIIGLFLLYVSFWG